MGFRAIEPVQITGLLSAPDTTLANGWNNVDISTITTIPAPATAVLFYFVNDSASSRTVGIRHANDNSNSVYASGSFAGAKYAHVIATLESPSGSTFGFNTNANTSVKFFVAGFFHDITVLEPQNRISSVTSTGTWQTKTINELPNGTNFILNFSNRFGTAFGNRWREVGGTEEYPFQGMSFIKVNPNKQFQVNLESSTSVSIGGYSSANWVQFVANVTSNSMANTTWSANSNWNDFPLTYPGKTGIVAFLHTNGTDGYNSGAAAFLRKKGSSWSIARAGNAGSEHGGYVIEPDANGQFQYWIEGGVANTGSIAVSTFFTETVPDYTLTDVNTTESVVAGQDSVVFSGRGLSTVDKIRIASNTRSISKNVTSANLTTVIASIPTDSELFSSNVAFGNVTFSVEVSGNVVANLSGTLTLSEQYGQHDVINVSQNTNSNTIYFAQTPAVKVGDKIAHEAATHTYGWGATIDSNGFISVGSSYSTQSDNLSYRIYSSDFEQWSTPGAVTIQSPYINARANSVRVAKSADGKRYSRYPNGDAPNLGTTASLISSGWGQNVSATGTITGPVPLAVFFDATGTTSTDPTIDTFNEIGYHFDFGYATPSTPGTWTHSGKPKGNQIGGPIAAHVYETPGTYKTTVRAQDIYGRYYDANVNIVAVDAHTYWTGSGRTNTTITVASGAWPTWANNTRYNLEAGGNYTSFGDITINGRYNVAIVGNKAKVGSITIEESGSKRAWSNCITISDVNAGQRIGMDLPSEYVSFVRANANNVIYGATLKGSYDSTSGWYWPRYQTLYDSNFENSNTSDTGIWSTQSQQIAIMGCSSGNAVEHCVRTQNIYKMFFAHNFLYKPGTSAGPKHFLAIRAQGLSPWRTEYNGTDDMQSKYAVVADNKVGIGTETGHASNFKFSPNNDGVAHWVDMVRTERNTFNTSDAIRCIEGECTNLTSFETGMPDPFEGQITHGTLTSQYLGPYYSNQHRTGIDGTKRFNAPTEVSPSKAGT